MITTADLINAYGNQIASEIIKIAFELKCRDTENNHNYQNMVSQNVHGKYAHKSKQFFDMGAEAREMKIQQQQDHMLGQYGAQALQQYLQQKQQAPQQQDVQMTETPVVQF